MSMKGFRLSLLLLMVVSFLVVPAGTAVAVGVRPLVIEMDVRPGDVRDFEVALLPSSTEETVDLTLYEPVQQLSGDWSTNCLLIRRFLPQVGFLWSATWCRCCQARRRE